MAISSYATDNERDKFKESSVTANAVAVKVCNPDGSNVGASVTVTADTEFSAAALLADNQALPTTTKVGAVVMGYDGTTIDLIRGDSANGLDVDITRSALPTGAATEATLSSVAASVAAIDSGLNAGGGIGDTIDSYTYADDSAFGVGTDSVVAVGMLADDTAPDSVNEGDIGAPRMSLDRIQYVRQNPPTTTHTCTESSVGDAATSVTLLAANTARTGCTIRNDSTAILYIAKGATATTSSPIRLTSQSIYELPVLSGAEIYRGIITGIWDSDAGGNARIEELV